MTVVARAPKVSKVPAQSPYVSVVIPTYNERDNVTELLRQLAATLPARSEVVIVDDSTDDTPRLARSAAGRFPLQVRVRHRKVADGGLGGAVTEGLSLARGTWVVVMDADLQHPPAVVADLVAAGDWAGADLVVASRYAAGGSRRGLATAYRQWASRASTWLARLAFPKALRGVTDPMSGFFAVRADAVDPAQLRPDGFKILMECIVRSGSVRIVEVPFEFGERHAGESKSSVREGIRFLRHIASLRRSTWVATARPLIDRAAAWASAGLASLRQRLVASGSSGTRARMLGFAIVGGSGVLVNLLAMQLLTSIFGIHYIAAAALANQFAVVSNFLLTDRLVFVGRHARTAAGRFGRFAVLNNVDLVARIPMLAVLVGDMGLGYLTGTVITLAVMFVLRFLIIDRLIYVGKPKSPSPSLEAI